MAYLDDELLADVSLPVLDLQHSLLLKEIVEKTQESEKFYELREKIKEAFKGCNNLEFLMVVATLVQEAIEFDSQPEIAIRTAGTLFLSTVWQKQSIAKGAMPVEDAVEVAKGFVQGPDTLN